MADFIGRVAAAGIGEALMAALLYALGFRLVRRPRKDRRQ